MNKFLLQVQALLDAALAEHGRIDVMVNNAGLGGDTPLVEMTDEEWDRVLDVTLTGSMRCTRASMRIMGVQGHGVIVNNASVLGWRQMDGSGNPDGEVFGAAYQVGTQPVRGLDHFDVGGPCQQFLKGESDLHAG